MQNGKKPVNFKQLGTTGLKRYGPYVYEEFLPELRWPYAGKVYQEMSDNDLDELKAAKEKLTTSAQSLFTKMYENMQQAQGGAAGAGPDMSNMGGAAADNSAADDDVIDGNFREV